MKYFIFILISIVLTSCNSSLEQKDISLSPCQDITYQKLKYMESKDLSDSQREYLNIKDNECQNYLAEENCPDAEKTEAKKNLIWIFYGLVLVAGVAIFVATYKGLR
jgi:hypothetical protein